MRIGYLTYGLDRSPTGIGRYALELLAALAEHPSQPELILLSTETSDPHGLWRQFETGHLRGCARLPALMTLGNLLVRQAARRYQLDLIHDPNGIAPFLIANPATRHVVTIHDAFPFIQPHNHNRLDNWRYRYMLPQALRNTDRVVTDSQHSCNDLKRYLAGAALKMEVVHCGVNPAFHPITTAEEREQVLRRYQIPTPYLLYLGGINARKNIARLLEAYAVVLQRHPALSLVIGGSRQWQTGGLDATLKRLKLQERVHFPGYLADGDLAAVYSGAEAFVFPSLYEGFGIPPLEAMACGTPVITSNISSLPEVAGAAAVLIDPYNVAELAEAIDRVLSDPALRKSLGARGLAQAARFTWQAAASAMVDVYADVLDHG